MKFNFLVLLAIGCLFYAACTDPTTLGADLFDEDQTDILFIDTLTLKASTELGDSAISYNPNASSQLRNYMFGDMTDPIFGQSFASIFLQLKLETFNVDLDQARMDSIVLVLPYDSSRFYGNTDILFGMDVLRLTEPFEEDVIYYSNQSLQANPVPLGSAEFRPNLDTMEIRSFSDSGIDTVQVSQQLRIRLSDSFGEELINLSSLYFASDTLFLDYLPGIQLKPSRQTAAMLSFFAGSGDTGIFLYYTRPDGGARQLQLGLKTSSVYFGENINDYTDAYVEPFINDIKAGEEELFVQGLQGLRTRIEIPYITNLKGIGVNKAELEVRVKTLPEDNLDNYEPIDQLVLLFNQEDDLKLISDLAIASDPVFPFELEEAFGGVLLQEDENEPGLYRMNISTHLQEMIDGFRPNELLLAAFRRTENAGRLVIFGPGDSQYGMKINIAYTDL